VRAALLREGARALALDEVPDPRPGPGEVLVRVRAAGLCGSDLGFLEGLRLPPGVSTPVVLGHEVAGEVAAAGEAAGPWRAGDRVVVNPYGACGACHACRAGRRTICLRPSVVGLHRPGGFAEWVVVRADELHRLPEPVGFAEGALAPDAAGTAYHAVVTRGALQAGESVAVFGAGGLGTHAILLARLLGASPLIVAVRRAAVAPRVRALGADAVVVGEGPDAAREVRRLTDRQGVALALDFTGKPEVVRACVGAVRVGGRAVLVGVGDEALRLPAAAHLVRYELDVRGAYGAEPAEIEAVLGLAAAGRLDLGGSVSRRVPLERIDEAVAALRDRTGDVVRVVVTPDPRGA
jgi:2-desacetyl-2-hydroxyethyl bacteriochlorophyllide A dehydrogenase